MKHQGQGGILEFHLVFQNCLENRVLDSRRSVVTHSSLGGKVMSSRPVAVEIELLFHKVITSGGFSKENCGRKL